MTTANHVTITQSPQAGYWMDLSPGRIGKVLWRSRTRVLSITALFAVTGVVVSLLTRPEYVSEARIMPEISQGTGDVLQKLASVAGFAGLEFGETGGVEAVRPDLYPNVLQSTPFILSLLEQPVPTSDGGKTSVSAMLTTPDSWSWLTSKKKPVPLRPNANPNTLQLTQEQQDLLEDIQQRVSAKMDTRSGIITVSARMPDPTAVAAVTQIALDYLTRYVSNYRTEKVRRDLEFYTNRLKEAKRRFELGSIQPVPLQRPAQIHGGAGRFHGKTAHRSGIDHFSGRLYRIGQAI